MYEMRRGGDNAARTRVPACRNSALKPRSRHQRSLLKKPPARRRPADPALRGPQSMCEGPQTSDASEGTSSEIAPGACGATARTGAFRRMAALGNTASGSPARALSGHLDIGERRFGAIAAGTAPRRIRVRTDWHLTHTAQCATPRARTSRPAHPPYEYETRFSSSAGSARAKNRVRAGRVVAKTRSSPRTQNELTNGVGGLTPGAARLRMHDDDLVSSRKRSRMGLRSMSSRM